MEIEELVPELRTTDLERAIHFYTRKLGFVLSFRHQDFYAGVSCGDWMRAILDECLTASRCPR